MKTTSPTELQTPANPDADTGQGGSYTLVNGKRVLVSRTNSDKSISRKAPLTDAAGNVVAAADPLVDPVVDATPATD